MRARFLASDLPIKVLYVGDDENDYKLVQNSLKWSAGHVYNTDWANSYNEAIAALDKGTHDVCLLNCLLHHDKNGSLKWLQEAHAKNDDMPIIFLAEKGDYQTALEAMHTGATEYLVGENYSTELLERTIRYALEHAQRQNHLQRNEE